MSCEESKNIFTFADIPHRYRFYRLFFLRSIAQFLWTIAEYHVKLSMSDMKKVYDDLTIINL